MNAAILVVDDDLMVQKILTRYLVEAGYVCHTADNADSAKKMLASTPVDLLLSDLKMPGDSGLDLIKFAKINYPEIGRVMITGYGSPEIASEIMTVGVYGYIIKPVTKNTVLITVENALRHLRLDLHLQACKIELEKKIFHRSEKLSAIMNNLDAGVVMFNSNMEIVEINRKIEQWFPDISPASGQHYHHAFMNPLKEEASDECPLTYILTTGLTSETVKRYATESGTREFRIKMSAIHDKKGEIYAGIALFDDITEQNALERDLRQAQKLEAVGQLAAGIAHEINTPVQYIGDNISFLQDSFSDIAKVISSYAACWQVLLEKGVVPKEMADQVSREIGEADLEYLWEEIPKTISQSLDGVKRVNTIVRAMKDFSHPGGDEKTPIDINKILESTLTVCRNEWKYVAEAETHFAEDLPLVPCFAGELSQVFLNIIVNAAHAIDKFSSSGSKGMGKITVQTQGVENGVEIRITDSGGGIPADIQERVFEPFFTTKERGKGTGQGLAIAHRVVVKQHQGNLTFESEEGKGTTFIISLPSELPT